MRLGVSNQYFYYTRAGRQSFFLGFRMVFQEELDEAAFREAATEAARRFPELTVRTVISGGKLMAVREDAPPCFFPEDKGVVRVGSDETNGHLFCFRMGKKSVFMSLYHGMTDAYGALKFLRTLFLLYADRTGYQISESDREALLTELKREVVPSDADEFPSFDPYREYADPEAVPEWRYDFPEAFGISSKLYDETNPTLHKYVVETSISAFIKKAKENGSSVVPFLVDTMSGAICRYGNKGELPVVTMVPADLRPLFSSGTLANFSDAMFFPWFTSNLDKPVEVRCRDLKDYLVKQRTVKNFQAMMASKCKEIASYEEQHMLEKLTHPEPESKKQTVPPVRRITYALSYPGKMDLGYGLDGMLEDFFLDTSVNVFSAIVQTYGDRMRALIIQRSDDPTFPEWLKKGFEDAGLSAGLSDLGVMEPDVVDLSALKTI